MRSVQDIAKEIIAREGGFVNDPDDPGGATKFGVTIGTLKRLGLDLNQDGAVTVADVRSITRAQATSIYVEHYFERPGIQKLPEPIWASVFDMYVNSGSYAIKLLQKLLIKFGFELAVDGAIGPQTIRAAHDAIDVAPDHFADAYGIERRNYYYRLADRRPASRKFARSKNGGKGGWIKRAEEFLNPKYHFSVKEHAQRTASWDS